MVLFYYYLIDSNLATHKRDQPMPLMKALLAMTANAIIIWRSQNMASLSVRKIDKTVYERLRVRAALHGVSMEEEVRQIIVQAVTAPVQVSAVFKKYFGPEHGIEITIPKRKPHDPMEFDE